MRIKTVVNRFLNKVVRRWWVQEGKAKEGSGQAWMEWDTGPRGERLSMGRREGEWK